MAVGLKIVNGDIVINNNGTLDVVTGSEKCARDFGKMLVTDSEYALSQTKYYRYNPLYGTELNNTVLYRGLARSSVREVIISILNSAIRNYLNLQESRDNLSVDEIISQVDFNVVYDMNDPRNVMFDIYVQTASGTILELPQYEQGF